MIYLSLSSENFFYAQNVKNNFFKNRRDIVDRNGTILATDVNLYDVGVRPKLLKDIDKKNLLIKLGLLFLKKISGCLRIVPIEEQGTSKIIASNFC